MSAVPFTELRLTIPLAIALGIEPLKAFFLACTGSANNPLFVIIRAYD